MRADLIISQSIPLRILHITEASSAGVLHASGQLARLQSKLGARVDYAYIPRADSPLPSDITYLVTPAHPIMFGNAELGQLGRIRELRRFIARAIKSGKYDVIHAHSSLAGVAARSQRKTHKTQPLLIYSPHGFAFLREDVPRLIRMAFRVTERALAKRAAIATASQSELEIAKTLHPDVSLLFSNGLEFDTLPVVRTEHAESHLRVAMVGRIAYQKAPWRFALVARELTKSAEFIWIGDGSPEDKERWLGDAPVTVTGWLDQDAARAMIASVDVVCFPTLWEGMPLALLDAQALAVPVVATDIVGNRDVIVDGVTGTLVHSETALVSAVFELLNDPELRRRYSAAAEENIRANFDARKIAKESLASYSSLRGANIPRPSLTTPAVESTPRHNEESPISLSKRKIRGIAAAIFRAAATLGMHVVPRKDMFVLFGKPDTEENSLVVAAELARSSVADSVVILCGNRHRARERYVTVCGELGVTPITNPTFHRRTPLTALWYLSRAAVIASSTPLYVSPVPIKGRTHVNLWHGTGPKWSSNSNFNFRVGAQALCTAAPAWFPSTRNGLGMSPDTRPFIGNPRQDLLAHGATRRRRILEKLGLDPDRPIVLWAPTYRLTQKMGVGHLNDGKQFTEGESDTDTTIGVATLVSAAKDAGVQLVVKPHPESADDFEIFGTPVLTTKKIIDAHLATYAVLGAVDGMISDYSSIWVDFLQTKRSVALYCPDIEQYIQNRGFNSPPLNEVADCIMVRSRQDAKDFFTAISHGLTWRSAQLQSLRASLRYIDLETRTPALVAQIASLARSNGCLEFANRLTTFPRTQAEDADRAPAGTSKS